MIIYELDDSIRVNDNRSSTEQLPEIQIKKAQFSLGLIWRYSPLRNPTRSSI